jgi:hypothetical protein
MQSGHRAYARLPRFTFTRGDLRRGSQGETVTIALLVIAYLFFGLGFGIRETHNEKTGGETILIGTLCTLLWPLVVLIILGGRTSARLTP